MIDIPLTEQMIIRHVRQEDLPALEWDGEYSHFRRLFADAYRRSRRGETLMWVAELPGRGIVGQLFVQLHHQASNSGDGRKKAYIYGFRVRSQYRNAGIGSQLLANAEADLSRRGYHMIALNVGRDNPDARRLYERFGYRVVAPEPGIWSFLDEYGRLRQVHEPAWRMEKKIEAKETKN